VEKKRADAAMDRRQSGGGAVSRSAGHESEKSGAGKRGGRPRRRGRGRRPAENGSVVDDRPGSGAPDREAGSPSPASEPGQQRDTQEGVPSVPSAVVDPDAPFFDTLGLSEGTLEAIRQAGYSRATPVQAGLIPRALTGIDVLGQARTGTGKTAAFVLPILERMAVRHNREPGVRALVLVPTRELAVQVRDEFEKLARGSQVHCVAVYGGKPIKSQIDKLAKHPQVVMGTPGRVLDHMSRGTLNLRSLEIVTLDEADRMLDIGFRPDIEKILRRCPDSRQTLLLSATVPPPVARLATRYMRDPEILDFSSRDIAVETIEQFYFTVDPTRKFDLLQRLLEREQPRQAIVFCRTKRGTDKVYEKLARRGRRKAEGDEIDVACIHGDLAQGMRDRVMKQFREGRVRLLIATDVVGRGIDVSGISHIINYDVPEFCDDYVHRVGRTGRMGREGVAYTFVTPEEGAQLTRIEVRIDRLLERDEIPGFEAFDRKELVRKPQSEAPGQPAATTDEPPKPKPASNLLGKGRGAKRFRRAL
jgi:ATP-dependent RNA helicase DeaD